MPSKISTLFQFGEPRPLEHLQARVQLEAAFSAGDVKARDQFQSAVEAFAEAADFFARARFKPLPPATGPSPFRMSLVDLLGAEKIGQMEQAGEFVFYAVGDTGEHGHGAEGQESVSFHMEQQIKRSDVAAVDRPALFYHLGDVIYFNGELNLYPEQFYEPYQYLDVPIVAIPGNHDGDNIPGDSSLSAFVKNFCTETPELPPMPGQSRRLTMTQPNVFFTLQTPFVTIIGLYSNVTGDLDDPNGNETPQFDWLVNELREANAQKFLLVAVHHPPFSADNVHGGELKIGQALDRAFAQAGRLPHLILTAHVHDYQRFSRDQTVGNITRNIPYIVAGAGGYAGFGSLHKVQDGVPFPDGVTLVKSNDKLPGFLRITASADQLTAEYFVVPPPPNHLSETNPATLFDSFSIVI